MEVMASAIRREIVAWAFAGLALHWVWNHGLDKWGLALTFAAMHLHPGPAKSQPAE
jgi:hypothetical protein